MVLRMATTRPILRHSQKSRQLHEHVLESAVSGWTEMIHAVRKLARGLGRSSVWLVLGGYGLAAWGVWALVGWLTVVSGLPAWTPTLTLVLLVCLLPLIIATAVVQGGLPGLRIEDEIDPNDLVGLRPEQVLVIPEAHPLHGSGIFTWRNTVLGAVSCAALLVTSVVAYMTMWAFGIGPVGSLLAQGIIAERDVVVLAGFENRTDDSSLSAFVTDAFELELSRSPVVTLADPDFVRAAALRMGVDASDPLALDCIENDGPDWPAGSDSRSGPPGTVSQGSYYCTLEQLDPGTTPGAQGWQISFTATGCDAVVSGITVTQTEISPGNIASCEAGPGATGGFDSTELALPEDNGGVAGAVSAVVLHFKKLTTLDATGSNTEPATGPEQNPVAVCRFLIAYTIPATEGDSCDVTLSYIDGLQSGGNPVPNKVTQDGQSVVPQVAQKTITVTASAGQQLAGDCNQDGDFDISDAICLLGFLFQATPPALPCGPLGNSPENLAVFDVNGDASIDLSDAVFKLAFLFSGGPPLVQGTDCFAADCAVDNPGCS